MDILKGDFLKTGTDVVPFVYNNAIVLIPQYFPFCCFCEIPIQHLQYHSARYGGFAIGFYREALVELRVRPVQYVFSCDDFILPTYHEMIESLGHLRGSEDLTNQEARAADALDKLLFSVSYVKSFVPHCEFDTVYCEREWRYVGDQGSKDFNFSDKVTEGKNVICFILSPRERVKRIHDGKLPDKYRQTPIVPFQDLVEH